MKHLLHIGYPKAGSTWLKENVYHPDSGATLLAGRQDDIRIPWSVEVHDRIFREDPLDWNPEEVQRLLRDGEEQMEGTQRGIWASEEMVGKWPWAGRDRQRNARRIRAVFDDPEILIVIRSQPDAIPSYYSQYLKMGGTASLETFLEGHYHHAEFRLDYLNYEKVVSMYQDLFGEEAVHVVPFELIKEDPEDFARAVAEALGLETPTLSQAAKQPSNSGYDPAEYGPVRIVNRLSRSPFQPKAPLDLRDPGRSLIARALKPYGVARRVGRLVSVVGSDPQALDEEVKDRVQKRFSEGNRRLNKTLDFDLRALGYPC